MDHTMPTEVTKLQREVIRLREIIASHEAARRERLAAAEAANVKSPAAAFDMDVFQAKSQLEGLADGSEDYESASERGRICRHALDLIGRLHRAVPKA